MLLVSFHTEVTDCYNDIRTTVRCIHSTCPLNNVKPRLFKLQLPSTYQCQVFGKEHQIYPPFLSFAALADEL